MKKQTTLCFTLCLLLAAALPAWPDVYIEKNSRSTGTASSSGTQEWVTRMWISDNHIRVEEPEGNTINITDFADGRLITLDTRNREYFTIPLQQVHEDFVRSVGSLKNRIQVNWRVEELGEGPEIAGYKTRIVRFHGLGSVDMPNRNASMRITMTVWVSDQVPEATALTNRMQEVMGLDKNPFLNQGVLAELRRIGGFHLKSVIESSIDGQQQGMEQTVTLVRRVDTDPAFYSVPPQYTEVSSPQAGQ